MDIEILIKQNTLLKAEIEKNTTSVQPLDVLQY